MIFELLTTISFMAGVYFIVTYILPAFVTLAGVIYLLDRFVIVLDRIRAIIYQAGIDYLESVARLDSLRDDHARRELAIADAGLALRQRRLELQDKRGLIED